MLNGRALTCDSANRVRLEGRIAVKTLLERCPDLTLDAHPAALTWHSGLLIRGPRSLPVRW